MEFITSRGFDLPTSKGEMENREWFNIWRRRNFPYTEPMIGDILYWFDTNKKEVVWKTRIVMIDRFPFENKSEILTRYPDCDESEYFRKGPSNGFFVIYEVEELEKISVNKPEGFRFPQLGWLRVDDVVAIEWFHRKESEDSSILDENIIDIGRPIYQLLAELNKKMQEVSPERVNKIISTTIRKDTAIVRTLKELFAYRCQFPNCGVRIDKKGGGYYIEVAHVQPVAKGGKSVIGNLLVLCPNHHKEFDHGRLEISEQSVSKLKGELNGDPFDFSFTC